MVATRPPRTMSQWEGRETQTSTAPRDSMVMLVLICMKYQVVSLSYKLENKVFPLTSHCPPPSRAKDFSLQAPQLTTYRQVSSTK